MDEDAKRKVLARRAKFVAAAVVGMIACDPAPEQTRSTVCLSIALPPPDDGGPAPTIADAGASADPDASPMPCLSVAIQPEPDASVTETDASAPVADAGKPPPRPCLKPALPRPTPTSSTPKLPPSVCLSMESP